MARDRTGGRGIGSGLLPLLDIAVVVGIALLTALLWQYSGTLVTPLRVALGVPFVVFLPGYALTGALFPGSGRQASEAGGQSFRTALSPVERLTFSVGLSIVVVPLVVLFLNFTAWGINPGPVRLALLSVTLVASTVAVVRRLRLPPEERFVLPVGRSLRAVTAARRVNVVIGVLLVLSVAVAGSSLAMADEGERFTEFSLLAENETGALVADGYPTEVGPNETATVHVGLGNQEGRAMNYTVVVEFQQFRSVDGERIVTSRTEADRYRTTLGAGESTRTEQRFSPPAWAGGDRVRLTFLLYTGPVAETPSIDDAYRKTHIWVDVPEREDGV